MACSRCGASVAADDTFCPKCGAPQRVDRAVSADPLRAGLERALGAQYELMRLLGRGGMGAVYLARERSLDRLVAIKVLPPEAAADAESRERFRREARTAAKLTHPNIVPLHTFGDVEGMLYFVMGYVRGESLAERMRREGRLPEEDVRRILAELADALDYAHRQGVVHRDIKPDNVLLEDETGRPTLTDFGVAKARASGTTLTEAGAVVGTAYSMSPEQASGARDLDGRSDLYSLGVTGYQMLAGRLPFEGDNFRDIVVQHMTQEPASLAALAPEAPADLTGAVMRCLAKTPNARWLDGRSLRNAIEQGGDDDAQPSLPTARIRGAAASVGVLLALSGVFAVLSYMFPSLRPEDTPWWGVSATVGGMALVISSVVAAVARSKGASWAAIGRVALEPPRWWWYWYPVRWRAPKDVWTRLPAPIRRWRAAVMASWGVLLCALGLEAMGLVLFYKHPLEPLGGRLVMLAGIPALVMGGLQWWALLGVRRLGRAHGLTDLEAQKLLKTSTALFDFWRKPKYAALLLPPPVRATATSAAEPRSPEEHAQAIRDLVGQLPSGAQALVSEAAEASRQVLGTVAALDAELAKLAQDADPQELEAVEAKLHALGPETPDEGDVRRQKRGLLVSQGELLRELNQRLAEVTDRRARLLDLLRTMWLQLANLRAEAAHDTLAVTEVSGRIKALCIEIDAHLRAAETVRVIARDSRSEGR